MVHILRKILVLSKIQYENKKKIMEEIKDYPTVDTLYSECL